MDLASLPRFSTPESPPAAPAARVPNCRRTLPLRFLLVLAIWGGLYILREQVTAIAAAREKAREAAREREAAEARIYGIGKWISAHGDRAILELEERKLSTLEPPDRVFTLSRNGNVLLRGVYLKDYNGCRLLVVAPACPSHPSQELRYEVRDEELELDLRDLCRICFGKIGLPLDNVWRFKRLQE
jgi:hypothetical protein